MSEEILSAPLTEPDIVACHFWEGCEIEIGEDFIRIVGWITLTTGEIENPERRIVARAVMPTRVARELIRDLRKGVARGGN